ncbi:hypothetical protein SOVF_192900, partial [Spinacia oleracea]
PQPPAHQAPATRSSDHRTQIHSITVCPSHRGRGEEEPSSEQSAPRKRRSSRLAEHRGGGAVTLVVARRAETPFSNSASATRNH